MTSDKLRPRRAAACAGIDQWQRTPQGAAWHLDLQPSEPVFAGHYPHEPILPGVYVFESLSQGVEHWYAQQGLGARVQSVRSMRFLLPFQPGHRLRIEATLPPQASPGSHPVSATVYRDGEKAGTARVTVHVQEARHA
jgi:3-hydroxyacyl-[acyl-carrier-protein] dehydratase